MDPHEIPAQGRPGSPFRIVAELFGISLLILFLELACIRWFPAQVLFLTFFTNTVLLASFLGMSVGCLLANRARNLISWTPALLVVAVIAALGTDLVRTHFQGQIDVGNQGRPELIYFGTEYPPGDVGGFVVPIEFVCGLFFLLIALAFLGPGQELGRALSRMPNRVLAYSINIAGSLTGILLFAACSWLELQPLWWFVPVAVGIGYFVLRTMRARGAASDPTHLSWRDGLVRLAMLGILLLAVGLPRGSNPTYWSPYYRIDYHPEFRSIVVNMLGHQAMSSRSSPVPAYALPYLLHRDAGGKPFRDVLIIGAGSGNDVSRALEWGAERVDAVEIDPVIQRLGARDHPDRPYQDPRVHVLLDDGRNVLRSTDRKYDLIVYALVDSLVLHSSYSNIRLESYLFTRQALVEVRQRLKPDGMFVMYNYFRQGWLVARLHDSLHEVFAVDPLVLSLPYRETIRPDDGGEGAFTMFLAGGTDHVRRAFDQQPEYRLPAGSPLHPDSSNGFVRTDAGMTEKPTESWLQLGLARLTPPEEPLQAATDAWPFLYLRRPMIPDLSLRGMAIMGGIALLLLVLARPGRNGGSQPRGSARSLAQMFFLGAGFMLLETKAVAHMALLFGSTWMVNSVVFAAILVMILGANLYVLAFRPQRIWPYYAALLATLVLNAVVPLDYFLGMNRIAQVSGSCLLVFAPVLFAGVVFAKAFQRSANPDVDFAANIGGAMLGGLAEYSSMLLGFQDLMLVAIGFYLLSAVGSRVAARNAGALPSRASERESPAVV